ncbi:MAG: HDOD domain-containing protein [Deltaproteobacteria bacterium]|nr:HDOD domain-containing protein [Deltaproteobacteria bacterium]
MPRKEEIISRIRSVPPLSHTARQIMAIVCDSGDSAGKLARVIETDAALTARVLTIVNASELFRINPITTIAAAMAVLGDKIMLGIALDYCTDGLMHKPLDGYRAEQGKLWEHNLLTAIAAKVLAGMSPMNVNPDEAFTGGILHDIGKSVLSEFLKGSTEDMIVEIDRGVLTDYLEVEEEKLGTNHCIIGAAMATMWKLPSPLPEIIRYHHHRLAAEETYRSIIYAVHLGDVIAMMKGIGTGCDSMCYHLESGHKELLGIRRDQFPAIMIRVDEEFQRIKACVNGGAGNAQNIDR